MLKYFKEEKVENGLAVCNSKLTFFGITIYKAKVQSTNNNAIRQLTVIPRNKVTVKGFRQ